MTGKRKAVRQPDGQTRTDKQEHIVDDFLLAKPTEDVEDMEEKEDSTDSEESVYSGLEEEDTDDEQGEDDTDDSDDDDDKEAEDKSAMSVSSDDDDDARKRIELAEDDIGVGNVKEGGSGHVLSLDEYEHDTSDEEDIRNTVGNIPMEWYRDYKHIGYTVDGKKIRKPEKGDELDNFLKKMDDPNFWRTVTNNMTGQDIVLSEDDLKTIQRIRTGKYPVSTTETYEPWVEIFTNEVMIHPLSNRPEHKRSFIPSKWERLKVGQLVHAMKMGWMKPRPEKKEDGESKYYMLWKDDEEPEITRRYRQHIPAPKLSLPGHEESYNPPPEYLFTKEEEEVWKEKEPEDRRINFLPQKYSSLRLVPAFSRFINERFERCLDLYLCPRQRKMRMNVNADDLIPKLPKPRDLQPFPTRQALVYVGHTDIVRCITVDPTGQWLASGSDDETIRLWEISTSRCMKTLKVGGIVKSIAWNPNPCFCLLAATVDTSAVIINPQLGDKLICTSTDNMINSFTPLDEDVAGKKPSTVWHAYTEADYNIGYRIRVSHPKEVKQVTWHGKGDYFATVMPQGDSMSVLIHQLSKRRSQNPFSKSKGLVQCVLFHPIRPFLFVATQRYVRVYNLMKQQLSKKLMTNCKWVSSIAVHPGGDNVIVGSYDCRLSWFDLDLSTKPYHTLRHHKKALRQVCYHKKYPLFASASDDGTVIVCHGMVYNDLMQNPLIVPVKVLRGHKPTKDLGVLDCVFHPTQPWIFSSGSDSTIRLYT